MQIKWKLFEVMLLLLLLIRTANTMDRTITKIPDVDGDVDGAMKMDRDTNISYTENIMRSALPLLP